MTEQAAEITRSTGIEVPGWAGPRPGGGYSGTTAELDQQVQANAEALRDAYGCAVEIRFNSDRRSGGAFLPNGVGIGAGLRLTRPEWERLMARYPDPSDEWPANMEPEGDGGQLYVDIYAPATALRDSAMANRDGAGRPYFCDEFPDLDAALTWAAERMTQPITPEAR